MLAAGFTASGGLVVYGTPHVDDSVELGGFTPRERGRAPHEQLMTADRATGLRRNIRPRPIDSPSSIRGAPDSDRQRYRADRGEAPSETPRAQTPLPAGSRKSRRQGCERPHGPGRAVPPRATVPTRRPGHPGET